MLNAVAKLPHIQINYWFEIYD